MKLLVFFLCLLVPVLAKADEIYTDTPRCAIIKNATDSKEYVSIRTDFFTRQDGSRSYHEEVMHLDPGHVQQICAKGPFYAGYKVNLMIKSFFPLFECKTKLEGQIEVHDRRRDDGTRDVYATCVE